MEVLDHKGEPIFLRVRVKIDNTQPKDSDKDGVPDTKDQCPNTPKGEQVDENGCPISGIEDLENINISLYPNPCVDVIHLSDIDNISNITIIDIAGKVIEKLPAQKDIAVQHLSAGTYIMIVEDKQSNLRKSLFIKQ